MQPPPPREGGAEQRFPSHSPSHLLSRLVLVAKGGEWDTANHTVWPQLFKVAVQALLLSAHRLARSSGERGRASRAERAARRSSGGQAATTLAALPIDLLVQIAAKAASPMSMWM